MKDKSIYQKKLKEYTPQAYQTSNKWGYCSFKKRELLQWLCNEFWRQIQIPNKQKSGGQPPSYITYPTLWKNLTINDEEHCCVPIVVSLTQTVPLHTLFVKWGETDTQLFHALFSLSKGNQIQSVRPAPSVTFVYILCKGEKMEAWYI